MHQTRLNWYMVLHAHSDETDELNLQDIARDFVYTCRQSIFGQFSS